MFTLTTAAQIKDLPWSGNHAHDELLFIECDLYAMKQLVAGNHSEAKLALENACVYGMGISETVTDSVVKDWLDTMVENAMDLPREFIVLLGKLNK